MKYGTAPATPPPQEYQYPPRPPRPNTYRPQYVEPEIDWKENWKATFYAFAFTLVVALMVMGVLSIRDYYYEQQLEEQLEVRRATFNEIVSLKNDGQLDPALDKLSAMGGFILPSEEDMARFKGQLLQSILEEGKRHYQNRDFVEALFYLELLEKYTDVQQITLLEWQAQAYRETNNPELSIKILTQLLLLGHRSVDNFISMAELYRDELNEPLSALSCFERANELAVEYYKAIYGNGYAIVLSADHLPDSHHELYTGLADIYLDLDRPEEAIKATNWNVRVWPDDKHAYEVRTKAYLALNEMGKACISYHEAIARGSVIIPDINCN